MCFWLFDLMVPLYYDLNMKRSIYNFVYFVLGPMCGFYQNTILRVVQLILVPWAK